MPTPSGAVLPAAPVAAAAGGPPPPAMLAPLLAGAAVDTLPDITVHRPVAGHAHRILSGCAAPPVSDPRSARWRCLCVLRSGAPRPRASGRGHARSRPAAAPARLPAAAPP